MINLQGSRFTDILPGDLAGTPEVKALAHAVGRQVERLCGYANNARIYAAIETLPDRVLDVLAIELRTPAYSESFSVKVKRALIKGTLTYYMELGTPAAVNRIIETIFEEGRITEWYEYGGEPHHFKAHTTNPFITAEDVGEFRRILETVKRLSAWLDEIVLDLSTEAMELYVGHWLHTGDFIKLNKATM